MKLNFTLVCLIPVALSIAGCGSHRGPQSMKDGMEPFSASTLAQMVGEAEPGDMLQFPERRLLGTNTVVVGREYTAASGRTCRKLLNVAGSALDRVVCEQADSQWYLARPLAGGKVSDPEPDEMASDGGVRVVINTDSQLAIKSGETLWSFAERATGNPYNWEAIATHNNIEDIDRIPAGTVLEIPPELMP